MMRALDKADVFGRMTLPPEDLVWKDIVMSVGDIAKAIADTTARVAGGSVHHGDEPRRDAA